MGKIVLEDFNEGNGYYKVNLAYLNKEQVEEIENLVSKWNPTDEDIKSCIAMCLTDVNEQRFKDYGTNLRDCLAWLEKQGEQKPAWTEEDKIMVNEIILDLKVFRDTNCSRKGKAAYQREIDWLEFLKNRVQPQQEQEWSEEDETIIDYLLQLINNSHKEPCTKGLIAFGAEAWLKSLRPQSQWKPSDEQMDALRYVTNFDYGGYKAILVSLYEQLKKLREE